MAIHCDSRMYDAPPRTTWRHTHYQHSVGASANFSLISCTTNAAHLEQEIRQRNMHPKDYVGMNGNHLSRYCIY
jgi:hypothetical protein